MSNSAKVSLVRLDSYAPKAVDAAFEKLLAPLGGIAAFVQPDQQVVLKPNLLKPAATERAVATHPEVIRGVARLVRSRQPGRITVTDSSGIGSATRCAKKLGLEESNDSLFEVRDADDGVDHVAPNLSYHRLKLSKRMMNADLLINLPKVKTHGQMGLTLAVKNTFGAIIGYEKAQWHFRAGRDADRFAKLVIDIHEILNPGLNIVDGIIGMEGNGPGSGDPRPLGLLAAATNPHALDVVIAQILGFPEQDVITLRVARKLGLIPHRIEEVGDPRSAFRLDRPWRPARPLTPNFVGSGLMAPLVHRIMSVRPHIDIYSCVMCGQCVASCVAKAMHAEAEPPPVGRIVIDTEKCIACFCCQEMCPKGAITVKAGFVARLLGLGVR